MLRGNDSLRQQTLKIQAEVARLRASRLREAREAEKAALGEVRKLVSEIRGLNQNLDAAEQAAEKFVESVAAVAGRELLHELGVEVKATIQNIAGSKELDPRVRERLTAKVLSRLHQEPHQPAPAGGAPARASLREVKRTNT